MGERIRPVANMISAVGAFLRNGRIKAVRAFDESAVAYWLKKLRENIPYLRNSVVGAFLLTFGVYGALVSVFKMMFFANGSLADVFYSLCAAIVSVPLLFSRGTLGTLLVLSSTGKVISNAIGMRLHINSARAPWGRSNMAFLLGMVLGSATFAFPPVYVLTAVVAVVACCVIFTYPEAAALIMAVLFPFADGGLLSLIAFCGITAFFIKLFRGKRSVSFHHHRAAALILLFIVFSSEFFSGSLKYTLMMLVYFLLCAADGYGEGAEKTVSVAVSVCGCVSAVYMAFICMSVFGGLKASFSGFDISAVALACAALIPLAVSFVLSGSGLPAQTSFGCVLAMAALLLYNGYYMYLIASVVSVILLLFFYRRRASFAVFAVVCAAYAVWVWLGGSNRAAVDHILGFLKDLGISYEADVFRLIAGGAMIEGFGASESFYGALLSSLGAVGIAALMSAAVLLFGYILRKKHGKGDDRSSAVYMRAWAPAVSAIVLLICGLGTNIWAHDGVFVLFWILMGAASSIAADAEAKSMRASSALYANNDKNSADVTI